MRERVRDFAYSLKISEAVAFFKATQTKEKVKPKDK